MYPEIVRAYAGKIMAKFSDCTIADKDDLMQSGYLSILEKQAKCQGLTIDRVENARVWGGIVDQMRLCSPVIARKNGLSAKTKMAQSINVERAFGSFDRDADQAQPGFLWKDISVVTFDPWKEFELNDSVKRLAKFIAKLFKRLPNESAKRMVLFAMEGKTQRDVAKILGCHESKVSVCWKSTIRPIAKQCLLENPMLLEGMVRPSEVAPIKTLPCRKIKKRSRAYQERRNEKRRKKRQDPQYWERELTREQGRRQQVSTGIRMRQLEQKRLEDPAYRDHKNALWRQMYERKKDNSISVVNVGQDRFL